MSSAIAKVKKVHAVVFIFILARYRNYVLLKLISSKSFNYHNFLDSTYLGWPKTISRTFFNQQKDEIRRNGNVSIIILLSSYYYTFSIDEIHVYLFHLG